MKLLKFIAPVDSWVDNGQDCKLPCFWCESNSLEVSNEVPHQFQCWSCKKAGNAYTLIQKYFMDLPPLKKSQGEELASWKPGTSPDAYRYCKVRKSTRGYIWPVHNAESNIVALYRYSKSNNRMYSTPKPCSLNILGLNHLKTKGTIWICEGHFDYAAFLSHTKLTQSSVLGLCGSSFPGKMIPLLEGRDIVFLGDNDDAGRAGVTSLSKRMKMTSSLPSSLKFLDWSEVVLPKISQIPNKFDLRDLCVELDHDS